MNFPPAPLIVGCADGANGQRPTPDQQASRDCHGDANYKCVTSLASCEDVATLTAAHKALGLLRGQIARLQADCRSPHARDELEVLLDNLATHAECLALCAQECEDAEREDPCLPVRDWHDERRELA